MEVVGGLVAKGVRGVGRDGMHAQVPRLAGVGRFGLSACVGGRGGIGGDISAVCVIAGCRCRRVEVIV